VLLLTGVLPFLAAQVSPLTTLLVSPFTNPLNWASKLGSAPP